MVQYVNKSALVAEIKRISCENPMDNSWYVDTEELLNFLNTLEVKEVDFEKEFDDYTKDILACDIQFEPFTHLHNCAKHFYELGFKAQKGE